MPQLYSTPCRSPSISAALPYASHARSVNSSRSAPSSPRFVAPFGLFLQHARVFVQPRRRARVAVVPRSRVVRPLFAALFAAPRRESSARGLARSRARVRRAWRRRRGRCRRSASPRAFASIRCGARAARSRRSASTTTATRRRVGVGVDVGAHGARESADAERLRLGIGLINDATRTSETRRRTRRQSPGQERLGDGSSAISSPPAMWNSCRGVGGSMARTSMS